MAYLSLTSEGKELPGDGGPEGGSYMYRSTQNKHANRLPLSDLLYHLNSAQDNQSPTYALNKHVKSTPQTTLKINGLEQHELGQCPFAA